MHACLVAQDIILRISKFLVQNPLSSCSNPETQPPNYSGE